MWEFTNIRPWAISELSKIKVEMGVIEMIELGRSFDVKEWGLEGYVSLLEQEKSITDEEVEHLGWKITTKLLCLRERFGSLPGTLVISKACTWCNKTGLEANLTHQ